jgi:hypothetical protein
MEEEPVGMVAHAVTLANDLPRGWWHNMWRWSRLEVGGNWRLARRWAGSGAVRSKVGA